VDNKDREECEGFVNDGAKKAWTVVIRRGGMLGCCFPILDLLRGLAIGFVRYNDNSPARYKYLATTVGVCGGRNNEDDELKVNDDGSGVDCSSEFFFFFPKSEEEELVDVALNTISYK
jgi:hypothetical protein